MDLRNLKSGDDHYMAYVGPPAQYDFMGATQFRLLCTLGLRAHHDLLDVGCGSLRAGRLLMTYLDEGHYFGIEPNEWLIEDAINNQIGGDLIRIKKPRFDHNSEFATDVFAQQFDYIVAQSIFSHAGPRLIETALANFRRSLKPEGIIAATFVEGGSDHAGEEWVYPGCVAYRSSTIRRFAAEAGLFTTWVPWYHPRQSWYLFATSRRRLPSNEMLRYLSGAVLFDQEFEQSRNRHKLSRIVRNFVKRRLLKR